MKTTNCKLQILLVAALAISPALAQVASHASTQMQAMANTTSMPPAGADTIASMPISGKPVVRVNDAVLTDRDLLREMLAIFPYARQHNGFPKAEEPKIRLGALKMIEFEELVYQEAERRKMTVPSAKLQRAEAEYRGQFSTPEDFDRYLKTEMNGSEQVFRQQIRRSLLVDALLKSEVDDKSKVALAEARNFYDQNPAAFRYKENFSIQTISIMPPDKAGDDARKQARKRAEDALRQAQATKSYRDFGLLAEKVSEDDFHVNMGDHKAVEGDQLPPQIVKAAQSMQPGQVSELLQLGSFFTFFRLNTHTPAGKVKFEAAKDRLLQDMGKDRHERLRADLDKKLRQNAKVQEL